MSFRTSNLKEWGLYSFYSIPFGNCLRLPSLLRMVKNKEPPPFSIGSMETLEFMHLLHSTGRLRFWVPFQAPLLHNKDPDFGASAEGARKRLMWNMLFKGESGNDLGNAQGHTLYTSKSIEDEFEGYESSTQRNLAKCSSNETLDKYFTWLDFRLHGLALHIDESLNLQRRYEYDQANEAIFRIIQRLLPEQDKYLLLGLEDGDGLSLCCLLRSMSPSFASAGAETN